MSKNAIESFREQPVIIENPSLEENFTDQSNENIRWSWACRILDINNNFEITSLDNINDIPNAGDVALFKVSNIGSHRRIVTTANKKIRLYRGDLFVGVFGNRYATDAYEGEVQGLKNLSLLTGAGMVGTVKSKHRSIEKATHVIFLGFLKDTKTDQKVNLKHLKFKKDEPSSYFSNIIAIIGSGMNSGKTTTCRKLIKSFSESGSRIAACKLTGSVSNRDQDEMFSASPLFTIDFSDYGFPSTYKCELDELLQLFKSMLSDIEKINPKVVIMEIADGVLQRETKMILNSPLFQQWIKNIIVTADSAPSALYTTEYLKNLGYNIIAVSGAMTSSPLYIREFEENSNIPIISSARNNIRFNLLKSILIKN